MPAAVLKPALALAGWLGLACCVSVSVQAENSPPFAHTLPGGRTTSESATLTGMVVPNGLPTTAWFEWGTNGSLGQATPPVALGNGMGVVFTSASLSGLPQRENFQCRLVATNLLGTTRTAARLFTTGKQVSTWGFNWHGPTSPQPWLTNAVSVAAGLYFNLAVTSDGTIVHWGDTDWGLALIPPNATNVVQVAGGYEHGIALTASGVVLAWGASNYGSKSVPADLTDAVAISASGFHNLALRSDGSIAAWGSLDQSSVPAGLSNAVAVASGDDHNLVLKADGTVVAWGANAYGQIDVPAGLDQVVAVAAGVGFSVALRLDGTVVAWGKYYHDSVWSLMSVPTGLNSVVAIGAGGKHALAILEDRSLVMWGATDWGQQNAPPGITNLVAIAGGGWHSVALVDAKPQAVSKVLTNDANKDLVIALQASDANGDSLKYRILELPAPGTLYQYTSAGRGSIISSAPSLVLDSGARVIFAPHPGTWGAPYASFSYVAEDNLSSSAPALVTIHISANAPLVYTRRPVVSGPASATLQGCILPGPLDGTSWFEWGPPGTFSNKTDPLPHNAANTLVSARAEITGLDPNAVCSYRLVSSNSYGVAYGRSATFSTTGRIAGWGSISVSQLPVPAGVNNAVQIAAGQSHALALLNDGNVLAWGDMVAQGRTNYGIPSGLNTIAQVACGMAHSLALKSNGTVVAWGSSSYGQTNVPAGLSNVIAVAAGLETSLALKNDGSIASWGYGVGTWTFSNVVALACAEYSALGLKIDGTVVGVGGNQFGQATPPPGLNGVVEIALGSYHSLALKTNGTVVAWGRNNFGQTNVPAGLSDVVGIACGKEHSLALKSDGTIVAWGNDAAQQATVPLGLTGASSIACGSSNSFSLGGNVPPQVKQVSATGAMNRDCIVMLSAGDPNNDPLTRRITSLPASGSLWQYDSGMRGAPLTVNSLVSDPLGRVIFAPSVNEFGWPYAAFTFAVEDGVAAPALAAATVNVIPAPAVLPGDLKVTTNGGFALSFTGHSNATYRVWASTNLVNWSALGYASQSGAGSFSYTDLSATNHSRRFYRLSAE